MDFIILNPEYENTVIINKKHIVKVTPANSDETTFANGARIYFSDKEYSAITIDGDDAKKLIDWLFNEDS